MKSFLLIAFIAFLAGNTSAQLASRQVLTGSYMTAVDGMKPGYYMHLNGIDRSTAEKKWQELMKSYGGKAAKVKKTDQYLTPGVRIREVSNDPIDVMAQFIKKGDDTEMYLWLRNGNGYMEAININGNGGASIAKGFDIMLTRTTIEEEIKFQERGLDKMDKEYRSLSKEKESLEDDIRDYEKKILESKSRIEQNILAQKKKTDEIDSARKQLEITKNNLNQVH